MRHEQERSSAVKHVEPLVPSTEDAGTTDRVFLSVLLRFEAGAVTVEKVNRVQGVLHVRRGQRQRRGLLVIAEDAKGNTVHHEVILDPRPGSREYVNDAGTLQHTGVSNGPEYALVRVPVASQRLVIRDAQRGARDGKPSAKETQRPTEPLAPDNYPLIATLQLGAP